MSVPEIASLMPFYTLTKGQQVRFTALDAATGAEVPAVVISSMVIAVDADATVSPLASPSAVRGAYTSGSAAA